MTTHVERGYLERDYETEPYLTGLMEAYTGMQATLVITDDSAVGQQSRNVILDFLNAGGMQAAANVTDSQHETGMQSRGVIAADDAIGMQMLANILDYVEPTGMQALRAILDRQTAVGMEVLQTTLVHLIHGEYLTDTYLDDGEYLVATICAILGMQTRGIIANEHETGMQSRGVIARQVATGMQARGVIFDDSPIGMQANLIRAMHIGMQATVALYNTKRLRLLCSFPSRGLTGANWTANSTATGDYAANNINTDIEEQIWRTADGFTSSIQLTCDTEVPQGVFLDTLAIRNHNLTTSATVTMQLSNSSTFATIGESIPLEVRAEHIYYIATDLPNVGYRYVRFVIDDPSNPDDFVSIGTIVFGAAEILVEQGFTDVVDFGYVEFVNKVPTEGHTNVSNSLALKKRIVLDFQSLKYNAPDFRLLRAMYLTYRTTHKCLVIPTPSPTDQSKTERFALFAKLVTVPRELHNNKDDDKADLVTLRVEFDESL